MAQCRKMIGKRRCKAHCLKGQKYCMFHSKRNLPFVAPVNRESKELSPSEKFVAKQAANRAAKIAGDAISARGVYTLLNPTSAITTVITGRYVPQATITANEAFLSESKRQADLKSAKQRNVKLTVKGKPSPGKRYRSTTEFVRADRTARGRIRVTPKGRDFLHSIETTPEREKRLARSRNLSKATIIGGRALRFGVPALMVGWTLHDVFSGDAPKKTREESLVYGLGGWVLQDASALATIAYTGQTTSLLTAGNFQWSDLIG